MALKSNFSFNFQCDILPFTMKKFIVILIPLFIGATLVLGYQYFATSRIQVSALQITATPQAEVFFDNISLGKTPFYNDKLKPGEHTIKLVPQDSGLFNFEEKMTLRNGVLTVIDRIFKTTEAESETSNISLEKLSTNNASEITVVSSPQGAEVKLNEQSQGITPLLLKDIPISDHQITIAKEGYKTKTLRVRPTEGYRLTISAKLSIVRPDESQVSPTATPKTQTVQILQTPTGFLRVRQEASTTSKEIARVSPNETFPLLETGEDWFKIQLEDGSEGWISSQYASVN